MRTVWVPDSVPFSKALQFFRDLGRPYELRYTGSSVGIRNDSFSWILSDERFWPKYLRELSKLKSEVKGNLTVVEGMQLYPPKCQSRVNRKHFPGRSGQIQSEELDLSKAYLTAANMMGLISDATFERLSKIRKSWRLRLLGAIATRKVIVHCTADGTCTGKEIKEDLPMRRAWSLICQTVDGVLSQLSDRLGPDFIYYWYDNLFALPGRVETEAAKLAEFSYKISSAALDYEWTKQSSLVVLVNGARPFYLPAYAEPMSASHARLYGRIDSLTEGVLGV